MIRVNVREVKTHLSRYLKQLGPGEKIVICRRNVPIAEIHPLPQASREPRPIGLGKGSFEIPPSFFDPLPEDILRAFEGDP